MLETDDLIPPPLALPAPTWDEPGVYYGEQARRQTRAKHCWNNANVPQRHRDAAKRLMDRATGPWRNLMARLAGGVEFGQLHALVGPRGTGKTQMGVCLVRQACLRGMSAYYVKALDLLRQLRACYRKGGPDELKVVDRFVGYGLLVIDEAHERGHSEFEDRTLVNILDRRYDAKRTTILISNQKTQAFAESLGPSVVSRIRETGEFHECLWPSFRQPSPRESGPVGDAVPSEVK